MSQQIKKTSPLKGYLDGRIEAKEARHFLTKYRALSEANPGKDLALDLSRVSFLASSGVGSLICLSEELTSRDTTLFIVAPSEAVGYVLDLLNLKRLLTVVDIAPEGES